VSARRLAGDQGSGDDSNRGGLGADPRARAAIGDKGLSGTGECGSCWKPRGEWWVDRMDLNDLVRASMTDGQVERDDVMVDKAEAEHA
jgi:hypothetical protein